MLLAILGELLWAYFWWCVFCVLITPLVPVVMLVGIWRERRGNRAKGQ